jgi:hypothetical protein
MTPLGALGRGLVAGALGTAFMTAYQTAVQRARGQERPAPKGWDEAPAPAQIGYRVLAGVFRREVPLERASELGDSVHRGTRRTSSPRTSRTTSSTARSRRGVRRP